MKNLPVRIAGPIAALLGTALMIPAIGVAKRVKSDWQTYFGAGIAPPYPLSGMLLVSYSHDQQYSYTDATGHTTSVHCSSDSTGTDCAEGTGIGYYLVMPDNGSIYVGPPHVSDTWPESWLIDFKDALQSIPASERKNHVFHFRWARDPYADQILCVQMPGVENIQAGKELKEYAKRHKMESCYIADETKWHPLN